MLPNRENAFVEERKITEYLLNPNHETGATKAFFFNRFGFIGEDIDTFKNALLQHTARRVILAEKINQFGTKYTLQCAIETPDKRDPCIETVWIVENGKTEPRLVTAYPAD